MLYRGNMPVWAAPDVYADHAVMQTDGNFVVYDERNVPIWASATWGIGAYLAVQDDGNLVIYSSDNSPVWSSGTGD